MANKHKHYALLLAMTQLLHEKKEIDSPPPTFYPTSATTRGELSEPFQNLLEILVKARKTMAFDAGERPDGLSPQEVAAQFRSEMRLDINRAIHNGMAETFRSGGFATPWR